MNTGKGLRQESQALLHITGFVQEVGNTSHTSAGYTKLTSKRYRKLAAGRNGGRDCVDGPMQPPDCPTFTPTFFASGGS